MMLRVCERWNKFHGWLRSIAPPRSGVQLIHFSGLSLRVGMIWAVDLRLSGIDKNGQTPSQLSDSVVAWSWIGFGIAV